MVGFRFVLLLLFPLQFASLLQAFQVQNRSPLRMIQRRGSHQNASKEASQKERCEDL